MSAEVDWRRCIPGGGGVCAREHRPALARCSSVKAVAPCSCMQHSTGYAHLPSPVPASSIGDPDGLLAAERGGPAWWWLLLLVCRLAVSQHYRIPVLIDSPHRPSACSPCLLPAVSHSPVTHTIPPITRERTGMFQPQPTPFSAFYSDFIPAQFDGLPYPHPHFDFDPGPSVSPGGPSVGHGGAVAVATPAGVSSTTRTFPLHGALPHPPRQTPVGRTPNLFDHKRLRRNNMAMTPDPTLSDDLAAQEAAARTWQPELEVCTPAQCDQDMIRLSPIG